MDTKHICTFLTFAQEGSFRKASQLLNYAPSTLSEHIRSLENELRVKLISSAGSAAHLTEAGQSFLPHAKLIYEQYQNACSALSVFSGLSGSFRIAATETVSLYRLSAIFTQYSQQYPQVNLSVRVCTSNYFPQFLIDDDVDLVFCPRFSPLSSDPFCSYPLYQIPLALISDPNHPLAKKGNVTLQDLSHYKLIFTQEEYLDQIDKILGLRNYKIDIVENLFLNSSSLMKRTLKTEHALSFLPLDAVREELSNKELAQVSLSTPKIYLTVYAVCHKHSPKQAHIESLLSFISRAISPTELV